LGTFKVKKLESQMIKKSFGGTTTTKGIIKISNIGYGYLAIPQEGEL